MRTHKHTLYGAHPWQHVDRLHEHREVLHVPQNINDAEQWSKCTMKTMFAIECNATLILRHT